MATTFILMERISKISRTRLPPNPSKQDFHGFSKSPVLVTRLIHYHSIYSPFYNPNHTVKDRAEIDLIGSISHVSSFIRYPKFRVSPSTRRGFFAYVRVGRKKLEQLLFMDTGSSLLWFNCLPCRLDIPEPIFDPKVSSTYKAEDCNLSDYCGGIDSTFGVSCDRRNRCAYSIHYGNNEYSMGHLATETLVIGSTSKQLFGKHEEVVEHVVVGCAKTTSIYTNGILGLGNTPSSLLKQRSYSKFSYCLGYYDDRSYPYHTLIIGDQAKQLPNGTPMIVQGKYYINLVSIRIGNSLLDIDPMIFKRNPDTYSGGMIVDSGSSYSVLPQVEYAKFEAGIKNVIGSSLIRSYANMVQNHTKLCYFGDMYINLAKFPTVQFQFENDALLKVDERSLFTQVTDGEFCLAFLPSETMFNGYNYSVLGIRMQQGHYISYDLGKMMFSFQQMDCHEVDGYVHDEL
ncbi:aspartic proteinase CDR1-like [Henckelia pumila]|uniref:aspartic proteinase CDR1-like n=1 Tax=Henckelia pumila TaxID=405737 RepID=UPI003C6E3340